MKESLSIEKAILRGHLLVNVPLFGGFLAAIGLIAYGLIQETLSNGLALLLFVLTFGLTWLYWSIVLPKWRIWAFGNVRNVHELKAVGIQEYLIWPDDSVFNKTEIYSEADKQKWAAIQEKFKQPDVFFDNPEIPFETKIYFAKWVCYLELVMGIFMICASLDFLIWPDMIDEKDGFILNFRLAGIPVAFIIMLVIGAFLIFDSLKKMIAKQAQIILNEKGIQTISTPFYSWENIRNEKAVREGVQKPKKYLIYEYPGGREKIQIDAYNTTLRKLDKLLRLYRGRFNEKKGI